MPLVCHHPGKRSPEHGGMRGLTVIVECINCMDNSLEKVKTSEALKMPSPKRLGARIEVRKRYGRVNQLRF